MANKPYSDYLAALAKHESAGQADPYRASNRYGYLGKYQMGEMALIDAGFYKRDGSKSNDFRGEWTGKHGIHSKEEFLNQPQAQEAAIRAYNRAQWSHIKNRHLDAHIGKQYGEGPVLTASGLLAGAHLVGVGNLQKYLESEGRVVPSDGNKVPITRYLNDMSGYDIPFVRQRQSVEAGQHKESPAHAVLSYAREHFSKGYEYGRGDGNWATDPRKNRSPNSRTDTSRDGRDLDGDGLRGIDCSSLVYQSLKGAGFRWPKGYLTTSQLFERNSITKDARQHFDVLSPKQGREEAYEPGDILMFHSRKSKGQHVGIFQGYDAQGRMQFFGSQVSTGPASVTIQPGGTWDGKDQILVGALRPKAEFFASHKVAQDVSRQEADRIEHKGDAHQHSRQPDAVEWLWHTRYKGLGLDVVPEAVASLSRKVQQACTAWDAVQTARVTSYLVDRAEKAMLPLQSIGEVLRESHGGRDLLHAVHEDRSRVATADVHKALQASFAHPVELSQQQVQHLQQAAVRQSS